MASAVVAGAVLGRRVLLVDAIAAAGLLTVLVSPSAVDDAGFLLSYAAVLALAATSVGDGAPVAVPDGGGQWASFKAAILGFRPAIIASLTAGFATLPLSAWLFGQVAPAGLVANIVLVPVASALQLPALLCGIVGAIFDWPLVTWCGGQAALLLESLVFGFADILPGVRAIEPPSVAVAAMGMLLTLLAGALAMLGRTRAMTAVVLVVVAGFAAVAWEPRALRVPFLQRRGIDHVDIMVVTHPHPDHAGGLLAVAQAFPVSVLWMAGDADRPGRLMAPIISAIGRDHVQSTPALLGRHPFGDVVVEVLAPAPAEGTPTYPELHANDNSLVMRVCQQQTCILLPGDLEAQGEELLLSSVPPGSLQAAVVKAGHHGSRTSSTPAFVAATGAEHVILCTGRHNTFGFPSPEVSARWQAAGARLWDTAVEGEVRVTVMDNRVTVRGFRER
jgi:competence protein ComEC